MLRAETREDDLIMHAAADGELDTAGECILHEMPANRSRRVLSSAVSSRDTPVVG